MVSERNRSILERYNDFLEQVRDPEEYRIYMRDDVLEWYYFPDYPEDGMEAEAIIFGIPPTYSGHTFTRTIGAGDGFPIEELEHLWRFYNIEEAKKILDRYRQWVDKAHIDEELNLPDYRIAVFIAPYPMNFYDEVGNTWRYVIPEVGIRVLSKEPFGFEIVGLLGENIDKLLYNAFDSLLKKWDELTADANHIINKHWSEEETD